MVQLVQALLLLLVTSAGSFAPLSATRQSQQQWHGKFLERPLVVVGASPNGPDDETSSSMSSSAHHQSLSSSSSSRRSMIHFFGVWTPLFLSWTNTNSARAEVVGQQSVFGSSTLQVSDAIKTLDMSLPSYGDIKNPTASIENVESLSVKVIPGSSGGGGGGGAGVTKSLKKTGIPMSSVLPSMGKKSAKAKKEEKAAAARAPKEPSGMEYNF